MLTSLPTRNEGACVTGCVGSDQASRKMRQQAPVQLAAAASDLTALIAVGGSSLAPDSTGTHLCNLLLPAATSFSLCGRCRGSWHAGQLTHLSSTL